MTPGVTDRCITRLDILCGVQSKSTGAKYQAWYDKYVCPALHEVIEEANGQKLPFIAKNDPLFTYHQWKANLRILEIDELKTVPYTPLSHPFVERLIGTIRRDFLNHAFFWNAVDLERNLLEFQRYTTEIGFTLRSGEIRRPRRLGNLQR